MLFGLEIKPSVFALGPFILVPLLTIAPLNLLMAEFSARFGKSVCLQQKQTAHQSAYLLVSELTPTYQKMCLHSFKNRTVEL